MFQAFAPKLLLSLFGYYSGHKVVLKLTLNFGGPFFSPSFSNTDVFGKVELDFCFLAMSEKETVPPAVSLAGLFAPSEDACGDSVLALDAAVGLLSMVL